ncbi:MAG: iron export ABC transporter permease subunit FetB [Planctomycetia bacterium]|nr:iron export ABC transporter permease subunit FetB [Planctomycetia bacterium]
MSDAFIELSPWQVAMAALLVVVSGLISLAMQLGLHRRLALASVRCVVQLVLIGLVLRWIFAPGTPWYVVVGLGTIMTMIAGVVAVDRSERRYAGIVLDSVISMWACAWLVTGVALLAVVRPEPWYRPQYAIPLLGMILANTLNGVSLGLNRFTREMTDRRAEIDTLLALGATRWEAARAAVQESIRTGMIPTINAMMIMGIVSLPGMMTGQLLAGVEPMQAISYQIIIMFFLAAATSLGTSGVVLLGYRRLFTAEHQFLPGRLVGKPKAESRKRGVAWRFWRG